MGRVLIPADIPEQWLDPLVAHEVLRREETSGSQGELGNAIADVAGIVCVITDRIDQRVFARAPELKVVANLGVGLDHVDVDAATVAGVAICNTPGVVDESTADLAFALILATSRQVTSAESELRRGLWSDWRIVQFLGRDVYGSTLGLVGYGRVGQAVERRATGFGMRVVHHSRTPSHLPSYMPNLDELLSLADVVSLHVPLTAATYHLIDRRRIGLMKPSAVLVNTARGAVVDTDAVVSALEEGQLFAAGFDVFEDEPRINPRLLSAPRTTLLPHIGGATLATRMKMVRLAAESIRGVLEGERPLNVVNPAVLG